MIVPSAIETSNNNVFADRQKLVPRRIPMTKARRKVIAPEITVNSNANHTTAQRSSGRNYVITKKKRGITAANTADHRPARGETRMLTIRPVKYRLSAKRGIINRRIETIMSARGLNTAKNGADSSWNRGE